MKTLLFAIGAVIIFSGIIFLLINLTSEKNLGGFQLGLIIGIGITVVIEGILISAFGKVLEYLEEINYSINILVKNSKQALFKNNSNQNIESDPSQNKEVYFCTKCNKIISDSKGGKCITCGSDLIAFG